MHCDCSYTGIRLYIYTVINYNLATGDTGVSQCSASVSDSDRMLGPWNRFHIWIANCKISLA